MLKLLVPYNKKKVIGVEIGKKVADRICREKSSSTKKILPVLQILELISEFSKFVGYKINTQNLSAFLYAHNCKLKLKLHTVYSNIPKYEVLLE